MSDEKDQDDMSRAESGHRIDRRSLLKITGVTAATIGVLSMTENAALAQTSESWDKVFPKSDRVDHRKVSFPNRFGITLVGDLYVPKNLGASQRLAALVVAHPYGGVKEQTSGLYAQTLAERGFVTLAYDASFHGESGGQPRANTIADFWVEDFSGAVDYLGKQSFVDRERIGALGVCGGGGYALAAAAIDQRIKAVATSVMYDIGQGNRQGLSENFDLAAFQQQLAGIAKQRWAEVDGAPRLLVGATAKTLSADAHPVEKEFWEYYGTPRGHHPRATPGFDRISNASMARFWSFDQLPWISPRPVLLVAGEHAHSRFFSEQANGFATDPKELYIVPGAGHVDLYDKVDLIPWDKLSFFFQTSLA